MTPTERGLSEHVIKGQVNYSRIQAGRTTKAELMKPPTGVEWANAIKVLSAIAREGLPGQRRLARVRPARRAVKRFKVPSPPKRFRK